MIITDDMARLVTVIGCWQDHPYCSANQGLITFDIASIYTVCISNQQKGLLCLDVRPTFAMLITYPCDRPGPYSAQ